MKYKKSEDSIEEIIRCAIREFSEYGYEEGSISRICETCGLSKGRIYHQFSGKDEIFLSCIGRCFDQLTAELKSHEYPGAIEQALMAYFDVRMNFFSRNPEYSRLFFIATVHPPQPLHQRIQQLKKEFDTYNLEFIRSKLEQETLNGIFTLDEAVQAFSMFQDYFNQISTRGDEQTEKQDSVERTIQKRIQFFLHGILS